MERREIPHDPRHLEVPSVASKTISKPMVCSPQTVQLSCVKISTRSKWTKLSLEPHHQGGPIGASKTIPKPIVCLAQSMHSSCTNTNTVSKQKEVRFHMTHAPRGSIGSVKNDLQAYSTFDTNRVPSFVKIRTIAERTEMCFHLSLFT
jgi:hypothetical protein